MTHRTRPTDHYKRGYQKGIVAAVEALGADFTDVETVVDDDGIERSAQCYPCLLRARGYEQLAQLFEHAVGLHDHGG